MIDGKRRNLVSRRYCLKCSPWGKNNRKNLEVEASRLVKLNRGKPGRVCTICGCPKPVEEFFRLSRGSYYSYCRSCDRQRQVEKARQLKADAVEYKGGKCCVCGYARYQGALVFHHRDPNEKDLLIAHTHRKCLSEDLKRELDKCVLLCNRCHSELHGGVITLDKHL